MLTAEIMITSLVRWRKRGFVFNEAFTNQLRSEISLYWLKDTLMVFNL